MTDVVLEDLDSMEYWGYKTTTKPTSLPDQWFRVIRIRKDTNDVDYHFMKTYGFLNSWAHKPGGTQPLSWNYSSPGSAIWSNERVYMRIGYTPTVTYESTIYYIIYKGIKMIREFNGEVYLNRKSEKCFLIKSGLTKM